MKNVTVKDINVDPKASENFVRGLILDSLKEEVAEQQRLGGFKRPVYRNDRKYNFKSAEAAASKTRGIVDVFDAATNLAESAWYIIGKLKQLSPVKTGNYRDNHYIDIRGRAYNIKNFTSKVMFKQALKDADVVRIYNNSVYANKLERYANKTGQRQRKPGSNISFLRINGIYEFFARKTNLKRLRNIHVRVGRSDYLPVINNTSYTLKDGGTLVLPVIELKLIKED